MEASDGDRFRDNDNHVYGSRKCISSDSNNNNKK